MALTKEQLALLEQQPPFEDVSERAGPGRMTLAYLEGHYVFQKANEIFGPDGWGYTIIEGPEPLYLGEELMMFVALVRVEVNGCMPKTDVGCTLVQRDRQGKISKDALRTAVKGCVTDAVKRALRSYGQALGLALYDDEYLAERVTGSSQAPAPRRREQAPQQERGTANGKGRARGKVDPNDRYTWDYDQLMAGFRASAKKYKDGRKPPAQLQNMVSEALRDLLETQLGDPDITPVVMEEMIHHIWGKGFAELDRGELVTMKRWLLGEQPDPETGEWPISQYAPREVALILQHLETEG